MADKRSFRTNRALAPWLDLRDGLLVFPKSCLERAGWANRFGPVVADAAQTRELTDKPEDFTLQRRLGHPRRYQRVWGGVRAFHHHRRG